MKNTFYNLLVFTSFLFLLISCGNNDSFVPTQESTTQDLLVGSWNVNRAYAGNPEREILFEEGDLILTFDMGNVINVLNNSTNSVPYPFDVSKKEYELEILCDYSIDKDNCDDDIKEEYFVFDEVNIYKILESPKENKLTFGNDPMHQFTFYLTRVQKI
jgi:hypothetical protein